MAYNNQEIATTTPGDATVHRLVHALDGNSGKVTVGSLEWERAKELANRYREMWRRQAALRGKRLAELEASGAEHAMQHAMASPAAATPGQVAPGKDAPGKSRTGGKNS
ncbi:hypothetical protein DL768_002817 [Monosporascus sp. mg162]|nr:hypothetical protein DL768_002817 [Monosporascus sp. mg162]